MNTEIKLDVVEGSFSENELQVLQLFSERFKMLWGNYENLKASGFSLVNGYEFVDDKIRSTNKSVDFYRLKGLFVDFRLFFAEKEQTNFLRVCNNLNRHIEDCRFRKLVKNNVIAWKQPDVAYAWHDYNPDHLLNHWFNGEIFHSDMAKREELSRMNELMTHDVSMFLLCHIIHGRLWSIRNINWLIQPLLQNENAVRLPYDYV